MADTIRETIIAAIKTNLQNIQVANGYNTEVGDFVLRCGKVGKIERIPAVAMVVGTESCERNTYGNDQMRLPIDLVGFDLFAQEDDWEDQLDLVSQKGEEILGDLRKAMGQTIAGATVEDVQYTGGGIDDYPSPRDGEVAVGMRATFEIIYETRANDPYNQ